MTSPNSSSGVPLSHLVRYVLTIGNMQGPDSIAQVRELFTNQGFVVDRIEAGEVEVASTGNNAPGLDIIQATLEGAGYELTEAETEVG